MKTIISQPRYQPTVNYLQRLYWADVFVLLDDVQRQGRGVENRNRILHGGKAEWLTIPIRSDSRQKIMHTVIDGDRWIAEHRRKLIQAYRSHPFFDENLIEVMYFGIMDKSAFYSDVLEAFLGNVCDLFGFVPKLIRASVLGINHAATGPAHLLDICKAVGATQYISGANGLHYGVKEVFADRLPVLYNIHENTVYAQPGMDFFVPWLAFFDQLCCTGLDETCTAIKTPLTLTTGEEITHV
jgi:hypothetical protein